MTPATTRLHYNTCRLLSRRALAALLAPPPYPDIRTISQDLHPPGTIDAAPAPGTRVRHSLPQYRNTAIHHTLYLPTDFRANRRYPVIFEYAGNGNYSNQYGDVSNGTVEGSNIGYGLSAGRGFLWVCLPYVDTANQQNAITWWGDTEATVDYAIQTVRLICNQFNGDPKRLLLTGFSRGAIACNYLGLRNDTIAPLWRAFLPYSHYDGVRRWPHADSDPDSALVRLRRLRGRPQFILHENSVEATRNYLTATNISGDFSFHTLPYRNHNDTWTLRPTEQRDLARRWLRRVLG